MAWDPVQYLRFAEERTRPCRDLAAAVGLVPRRIADLGCGPGNSTAVLAARWPEAELHGIDASPEMIAAAQRDSGLVQAVWENADLARWEPTAPVDLAFSNAALQWVPNHARLLPRLLGKIVAPDGALAVQVPRREGSPAQRAMEELAASAAWRGAFAAPPRVWHAPSPEFYYDCLAPRAARLDLWTTDYVHVMPDAAAIAEWYRGTGLRPYLDQLSGSDPERFVAAFTREVAAAYPARPDGQILFLFPRLFFVAYRG